MSKEVMRGRRYLGLPCVRHGAVERYSKTKRCVACVALRNSSENSKEYFRKNQDSNYSAHIKRAYGILPQEYKTMLSAQNGRCAICGTNNPGGKGGRLQVDHCHSTGAVRKLLCHSCNRMIGNSRDSAFLLIKGAEYLGSAPEVTPIWSGVLSMGV